MTHSARNGPDRAPFEEIEQSPTADYCIGADFICIAFSGNSARAYETVFDLASKHALGFFDASGDGAVWFPKAAGELEMLHLHGESDPPGRLAREVAQAIERQGVVHAKNMEDAIGRMMEMLQDPRGAKPIMIQPNGDNPGKVNK